MNEPLSMREESDLRAAFERDKWAGEWNSLPTAIDRLLADRAPDVAAIKAEALLDAADDVERGDPVGNATYSARQVAHYLRGQARLARARADALTAAPETRRVPTTDC